MYILIITLLNVFEHLVKSGFYPLLFQLQQATFGPLLTAGGEIDFQIGVRQNHGADIPPVHDDVVFSREATLHLQQIGPADREGRDIGGTEGNLRHADGFAYILPIEEHALQTRVIITDLNLQPRQDGRKLLLTVPVNAGTIGCKPHCTVDCAGIQIEKMVCCADFFRQGALSGSRRPVNGDGIKLLIHDSSFP